MKTVAYLRVSTRSQDLANQKLAILVQRHSKFLLGSLIVTDQRVFMSSGTGLRMISLKNASPR